jgi:hypothetical protein
VIILLFFLLLFVEYDLQVGQAGYDDHSVLPPALTRQVKGMTK